VARTRGGSSSLGERRVLQGVLEEDVRVAEVAGVVVERSVVAERADGEGLFVGSREVCVEEGFVLREEILDEGEPLRGVARELAFVLVVFLLLVGCRGGREDVCFEESGVLEFALLVEDAALLVGADAGSGFGRRREVDEGGESRRVWFWGREGEEDELVHTFELPRPHRQMFGRRYLDWHDRRSLLHAVDSLRHLLFLLLHDLVDELLDLLVRASIVFVEECALHLGLHLALVWVERVETDGTGARRCDCISELEDRPPHVVVVVRVLVPHLSAGGEVELHALVDELVAEQRGHALELFAVLVAEDGMGSRVVVELGVGVAFVRSGSNRCVLRVSPPMTTTTTTSSRSSEGGEDVEVVLGAVARSEVGALVRVEPVLAEALGRRTVGVESGEEAAFVGVVGFGSVGVGDGEGGGGAVGEEREDMRGLLVGRGVEDGEVGGLRVGVLADVESEVGLETGVDEGEEFLERLVTDVCVRLLAFLGEELVALVELEVTVVCFHEVFLEAVGVGEGVFGTRRRVALARKGLLAEVGVGLG